jgi:predicted nucleic acid-binding protein
MSLCVIGLIATGVYAYITRNNYVVCIVISAGLIFGNVVSYKKYELYYFEEIHNADAVMAYIDTMPVPDLRNKLKSCQIDKSNCTIVFVQKK